jgi:hypothetical protein
MSSNRILAPNGAPADAAPRIVIASEIPGAAPSAAPQAPQVNIGVSVADTPMGPAPALQITIDGRTITAPLDPAAMQSFGCACIVAANEAARQQAEIKARRDREGDTR